jgi:hypothetical protein
MHCCAEVTESSTNKQHHQSLLGGDVYREGGVCISLIVTTHERAHTHARTRPRKVTYSSKQAEHSRQNILGEG